nr:DUF2304 domain-containing protein [uncultured Mediterraneibacter sp.]
MGDWLKLIVILAGIYFIIMTLLSLAKRRMTEQFCLAWALLGVLMIVGGIVLNPDGIEKYISRTGIILIGVLIAGVLWAFWFVSKEVSILIRKNQELAMQTSLLNRDSEMLIREVERLKGELAEQRSEERGDR